MSAWPVVQEFGREEGRPDAVLPRFSPKHGAPVTESGGKRRNMDLTHDLGC